MRRTSYYSQLYIVKEDGDPALRQWFLSHLIEDRAEPIMSYYQYLGHLKDRVSYSASEGLKQDTVLLLSIINVCVLFYTFFLTIGQQRIILSALDGKKYAWALAYLGVFTMNKFLAWKAQGGKKGKPPISIV